MKTKTWESIFFILRCLTNLFHSKYMKLFHNFQFQVNQCYVQVQQLVQERPWYNIWLICIQVSLSWRMSFLFLLLCDTYIERSFIITIYFPPILCALFFHIHYQKWRSGSVIQSVIFLIMEMTNRFITIYSTLINFHTPKQFLLVRV